MKSLRNSSGQLILESVLIMTILLAITMTTARYLKNNEIISKLMSGPWVQLSE